MKLSYNIVCGFWPALWAFSGQPTDWRRSRGGPRFVEVSYGCRVKEQSTSSLPPFPHLRPSFFFSTSSFPFFLFTDLAPSVSSREHPLRWPSSRRTVRTHVFPFLFVFFLPFLPPIPFPSSRDSHRSLFSVCFFLFPSHTPFPM